MRSALDLLALALLHGTAVTAVVWALDAMLKSRISPALASGLWTVALAKFLVPIGPAVTSSPGFALSRASSMAPMLIEGGAFAAPAGLPWMAILFAAYAAAVVLLALRQIVSARRLDRAIAMLPLASPGLLAAVRESAVRLGLRRLPKVRIGSGPFIAGLWRPTLVVPSENGGSAQARAVLLHELAHLRRGDPWVRLLQGAAQTLFFFWPPVHWVNGKIEQHRELACDLLSLEHGTLSPAAYARVLLDTRRTPLQLAALEMVSHSSRLEQRIDMLLKLKSRRARTWSVLAVISGAVLALSGTALAVDEARSVPPSSADQAQIDAVVHEHRAEISACYDAAALGSPGLEGTLVFGWSIKPSGAYDDGCVESSKLTSDLGFSRAQEDELFHCVSHAIRGWQFAAPKSGAKLEVSYPFVFKPAPPVPNRD